MAADSPAAAIRVRGLTKSYGRTEAVRGIDFDVGRPEIVGLLGPNGAGKTTTIRMLAGFLQPSAGSIEIDGRSMTDAPVALRRVVGYLPERTPLRDDMSVRDYLRHRGRLFGVRDGGRVMATMETCGIAHRANELIGRLSKGLKQRVGLAQSILHDPAVLILDEPGSGIDPVQIVEIRNLIRDLGSDRSILFSSHVLAEAAQICDRVLVIGGGRILGEHRRDEAARHLRVETAGDRSGVEALLAPLAAGPLSITGLNGRLSVGLALADGREPHEVAAALTGAGLPLHRLAAGGDDLEQMFLRLVGGVMAA